MGTSVVLRSYRRRKAWKALTAPEKKLLGALQSELAGVEREEGEASIELVDVVDEASGATSHLLALWPFGSGALVDVKTKDVVATIAQHHFDAGADTELVRRLAAPFEKQRDALGIREAVTFPRGAATTPARATPPADGGVLSERIAAMRAALARGEAVDPKELWAVATKALSSPRGPLPVRRPFELAPTERAALELLHEGHDPPITGLVGLPTAPMRASRTDPTKDPGDLARFLGHAALGPLDAPVAFGGEEHPAWCLLSDAVHDLRPNAEVVGALASLPRATTKDILRRLVEPLANPYLSGAYAPPPPGAQPGSPVAQGAHKVRLARFVLALSHELGDDAVEVARELLASRADWLARWLPQLTERPAMAVPHTFELTIALGILAAAAQRSGASLDESHDALLAALARSPAATYALAVVLALLEPERAAKLARADLGLIEQFPSPASAEAAVALFEASGGGPFMTALFQRVVAAIGPAAAPAIEAAMARGSPQKSALARSIAAKPKPKAPKKPRKPAG